jgi:hypothetical protein
VQSFFFPSSFWPLPPGFLIRWRAAAALIVERPHEDRAELRAAADERRQARGQTAGTNMFCQNCCGEQLHLCPRGLLIKPVISGYWDTEFFRYRAESRRRLHGHPPRSGAPISFPPASGCRPSRGCHQTPNQTKRNVCACPRYRSTGDFAP